MTTNLADQSAAGGMQVQEDGAGPSAEQTPADAGSVSLDTAGGPRDLISDLSYIRAVATYLNRVGAKATAMRTARVQEQEGRYKRDVAVIKLNQDGQVTVSSPSGEDVSPYEPTESERYAIGVEASAARLPELKLCIATSTLPEALKQASTEDVFEFRGLAEADGYSRVVMLQQRVERPGGKSYVPWTYWSDNIWRMIEPEGELPLWGIDQLRDNVTAFVHEGAKAARHVRRMAEAQTPGAKAALAAHPWGDALRHGAHVGWIGGALSPHRTDWSVLSKAGVLRVVIVADNDAPGHAAVPKIARALRSYPIHVEALRFDNRWPSGFDLADPFPESMFK